MGLTDDIAGFVAGLSFEALPPRAVEIVTAGFTDCVGVTAAGWDEPVVRLLRRHLGDAADTPFLGIRGGRPEDALVYGAAAHALDYDDTGLAAHPSALLVPAILAEAEATGADGRSMIAAYVAGYEIWAELWLREPDHHHAKGWHPTAIFGAPASAAAASVLRGFDVETTRRAVAIAASLSAGIVANFGTMTKPFQVGRAAQSGLLAARLAEAGMTAAPDALEHELGFLRAFSPRGSADRARAARFGREWHILRRGLNFKLYPVCYAMHRAIDSMLDLRAAECFAAADIAAVTVHIGETQAAMLRRHRPLTSLDAKFSLEFAMAAAALDGRVTRAELAEEVVRRPDIQAFLPRVSAVTTAETDEDEPVHAPFDQVVVTLGDRRRLEGPRVTHARGHFRRPLDPGALALKFEDCTAGVLEPRDSARLFDRLQALATLPGVSALRPGADLGRKAS